MGIFQCRLKIAIRTPLVAERPGCKTRNPADVASRERYLKTVGRGIRHSLDAVSPEIVILPLFSIRDNRGAGCFEPPDGVLDRLLVVGVKRGIRAIPFRDHINQPVWSGYSPDRLGWYCDGISHLSNCERSRSD